MLFEACIKTLDEVLVNCETNCTAEPQHLIELAAILLGNWLVHSCLSFAV
jgi:hypothetical protein